MWFRPNSVKIGTQKWKIRWRDFLELDEEEVMGLTKSDQLEILVRDSLPLSLARETLMHELLHAIWATFSIELELEGDLEEQAVQRQSEPLILVLRNNRWLRMWLTGL